jgi:hypothetical protein
MILIKKTFFVNINEKKYFTVLLKHAEKYWIYYTQLRTYW